MRGVIATWISLADCRDHQRHRPAEPYRFDVNVKWSALVPAVAGLLVSQTSGFEQKAR
jgi:hypothetical protein